jgi:hypothetical protein
LSNCTSYQDIARGTVSQASDPRSDRCGSEGWVMAPSGTRGVLNDTLSVYFADATLACIPAPRRDPTPELNQSVEIT